MSGVLDLLSAQNITRAQATVGVVRTAQSAFGSSGRNVSTAGRAAIAGSLFTTLGGVLTGFSRNPGRPPEKGFNITGFQSRLNKLGGLSNTSKFLVSITPPPCLRPNNTILRQDLAAGSNEVISTTEIRPRPGEKIDQGTFINQSVQDLVFLCGRTSLPGIAFSTAQIQKLGYGTPEAVPVMRQYQDITLNFYVDVSGVTYGVFTKWLSNIVNWNDTAVGSLTADGAFYNEIHYKRHYISPNISIYVFDVAGNNFIEVKLIEAYPIGIGPVDLSWGNYDDIAIVPVRFAYKTWRSNYMAPAKISGNSLRNLTLAGTLMRIGTAVQGGSTLLRRPTNVMDAFNLVRNGTGLVRNLTS